MRRQRSAPALHHANHQREGARERALGGERQAGTDLGEREELARRRNRRCAVAGMRRRGPRPPRSSRSRPHRRQSGWTQQPARSAAPLSRAASRRTGTGARTPRRTRCPDRLHLGRFRIRRHQVVRHIGAVSRQVPGGARDRDELAEAAASSLHPSRQTRRSPGRTASRDMRASQPVSPPRRAARRPRRRVTDQPRIGREVEHLEHEAVANQHAPDEGLRSRGRRSPRSACSTSA